MTELTIILFVKMIFVYFCIFLAALLQHLHGPSVGQGVGITV